ncbi:MAG: patatin-like phospholipase family protein [Saprospiraceae bacterium]|nr:patatin-like phospholipase family protein [Saprospiraceae bacterium]
MKKPAFKILSIDGGGIRGIIPGMVVAEIEKRMGKPACKIFDLMAGTSTGGIIACGLVIPDPDDDVEPRYSAMQLVELYQKEGKRIFEGGSSKFFSMLSALVECTYAHEGIEGVLAEYFGDAELKDALKNILITSYDIELRKPMYFKSRLAKDKNLADEENFKMTQVTRATSAAPTYFQPTRILSPKQMHYSLVDGGVFANNPSVLAYAEAKELYKLRSGREINAMPTPEEGVPYFMLSLGTGRTFNPYKYEDAKGWGAPKWIRPMIDILMQGVSETVDYQMRYLLPDAPDGTPHYRRINPLLPHELSEMDNADADNIKGLMEKAQEAIAENDEELDRICELLS